jgi:hypothetical protein
MACTIYITLDQNVKCIAIGFREEGKVRCGSVPVITEFGR